MPVAFRRVHGNDLLFVAANAISGSSRATRSG
jgi:hypothetical protein